MRHLPISLVQDAYPRYGIASLAILVAAAVCSIFSSTAHGQTYNAAPTVQLWTTTAETVEGKQFSLDFCDDHALDRYSEKVWWNGVDVTATFPWQAATGGYSCSSHATSQGLLTPNLGLNTIQAKICDQLNYYYSPTGPLCTTTPIQTIRFRNVDVTPDNANAKMAPDRVNQYFDFAVQKVAAAGSNHFGLHVTWTGNLSSCGVADSSIGGGTVRVTCTSGPLGTTGTITLRAATAGAPDSYDEGSVTITNDWPAALTVDVGRMNNDNQVPERCAAACFAPTASVATVPFFSMDTPHSVALTYQGDRVAVRPFVYADLSLAPSADPLRALTLEVKNQSGANIQFLNGENIITFSPGAITSQSVRLAAQFDAAANSMTATGMYPVTIVITGKYDDHNEVQSIPAKIMVVNDRASRVARGWVIAGVQRLYEQADGGVLVAEAGGAAVYFASSGGSYPAPPGEFTRLTVSGTGTSRRWVRATPDSTKYIFNSVGQLLHIVGRWSDSVSFVYDDSSRVVKILDPFLRVAAARVATTLTYTPAGISQITEPTARMGAAARVTTFTVDADSTLRVVQDPDSGRTTFGYEAGSRRLLTITDRRNATTTFVYRNDQSWKLATIRSPVVSIDTGRAHMVDSSLAVTFQPWQTLGVPTGTTSLSSPATPVNVAAIDAAVTDPAGHTSRFTVDRWGQPLRATDAIGNVTQTVRNTDGLPTQVRTPSNLTTTYTYTGPFVRSVDAPGARAPMYYDYAAYGQLRRAYDGVGPVYDYFPNDTARGRLDSTKVGGAFKTTYSYDAYGRITTIVDPKSHTTTFTYDPIWGNRDSTQNPTGQGYKTRFDRYGRDSVTTSAGRGTVTTGYDVLNRVLQQDDGLNPNPVRYSYAQDLLVRVVDPKGQVYKFGYNAAGWQTTVYDPADTTRFSSNTFNADGLPASHTNREGKRVDMTYDAIHRLQSRVDSTGSLLLGYDGIGTRLSGESRDATGARIALDSTFLSTSGWTDSLVTWLNGQRFRRSYHKDGDERLDAEDFQSSPGIDFYPRRWYYNATSGVLDSVGLGSRVVKLTYDADGMRSVTDWRAGVTRTETWTSDHLPDVTSFSTAAFDDAFRSDLDYDNQGRVATETRRSNGGNTLHHRSFLYDAIGELQRSYRDSVAWVNQCINTNTPPYYTCSNVQKTFVTRKLGLFYDPAGNLTQQADSVSTVTSVDTTRAGNRLRYQLGVTYTYDKDGNTISRATSSGTTLFGWDASGQLRWVANGSDTTFYDYDAAGQLVRRRKSGGVTERWFLWDGGQILAEMNGSAIDRIAEYAYYGGVDDPMAFITGPSGASAVHWYQQGGTGNVEGLISASGSVEQQLRYDEWGGLEAYSSTITDSTRLRWKGMYYDGGPAGLYYARARWYDPQARRFISEDPIGLEGGINEYVFAGNDPVNGSDPSGLQCPCPPGVVEVVGHRPPPTQDIGAVLSASISTLQTIYWRLEYLATHSQQDVMAARYSGRSPQASAPACSFTLSNEEWAAARDALRRSQRAGREMVTAVENGKLVRVPVKSDRVHFWNAKFYVGTTAAAHGHLPAGPAYDPSIVSVTDSTEAYRLGIKYISLSKDWVSMVAPGTSRMKCRR